MAPPYLSFSMHDSDSSMFPPDSPIDEIGAWPHATISEPTLSLDLSPWEHAEQGTMLDLERSSSSGSSSHQPPNQTSGQQKQRTLAPNLTRRSHRKSRAGCFVCKTRKIKCGEEKPKCRNCNLKELDCQYPDNNQQVTRATVGRRPLGPQKPLTTTAGTFTLTDFKFFQHFLQFAYPSLPAGNEHVWVSSVPQLALQNEYLMHSVLSLGASHLHRLAPENDYLTQAIMHRGHAIAGLNKAIAHPQTARNEADAMLAACYALTFQASYMDDGLPDFITMVRGCALVAGKIQEEHAETSFDLSPNLHLETLEPVLSNMPLIDREFLNSGIAAMDALQALVQTEPETTFYNSLASVLFSLQHSTREGFKVFSLTYSCWYLLAGDTFRTFTDPQNVVAQILLAYFVSLQLMLAPVTAPMYESPQRVKGPGAEVLMGIVAWGERIFDNVPENFQRYLTWPKLVIVTIRNEITGPKGEYRLLRLKRQMEDDEVVRCES